MFQIGKGKIKILLFADNTIVYIINPMESTEKLPELELSLPGLQGIRKTKISRISI